MRIDLHLDLSMNAIEWNRDLRLPVSVIREREVAAGLTDKADRGRNTVSFPALREGDFGLVVATQIARTITHDRPHNGWQSPEQAWAQTQAQLAWYREMEAQGELVQVVDKAGLEAQIIHWNEAGDKSRKPIGYVLSLEGADSLVRLSYLEKAYEYGLRALGPAHYGPGRYAYGTDGSGKMGEPGISLVKEMDRLGMILDVTHLNDDAFWQALDIFKGPVWASHNNCRALVDHNRQFSDDMIRALVARGAVIGGALDAWMMVPGWERGKTTPASAQLKLERIVEHIDHICQIAGNARHVGIGSDLDGAYGREQSPYDLETIADLGRLPTMLATRGYSPADVEKVMHGNWLRFLRHAWK